MFRGYNPQARQGAAPARHILAPKRAKANRSTQGDKPVADPSVQVLSLDRLCSAVAGKAAAVRVVTCLGPAGGDGDKLFPPTYNDPDKKAGAYGFEPRRIDGREVNAVLLDSVASQANRMEQAL